MVPLLMSIDSHVVGGSLVAVKEPAPLVPTKVVAVSKWTFSAEADAGSATG
jgi:hypothetical protein